MPISKKQNKSRKHFSKINRNKKNKLQISKLSGGSGLNEKIITTQPTPTYKETKMMSMVQFSREEFNELNINLANKKDITYTSLFLNTKGKYVKIINFKVNNSLTNQDSNTIIVFLINGLNYSIKYYYAELNQPPIYKMQEITIVK
jgi:hypothetical protein